MILPRRTRNAAPSERFSAPVQLVLAALQDSGLCLGLEGSCRLVRPVVGFILEVQQCSISFVPPSGKFGFEG
eukprot:7693127-Pyramimonas_sp.AAC.1